MRVVTRIDRFGEFALRPESWVLAYNRPAEIGRLLAFVFTIGIMLALGFLGLGSLRLKGRRTASPS